MKRGLLSALLLVFGLGFLLHQDQAKETILDLERVVIVQPGDTLWSIAKNHYQATDIQKAVYYMQKFNGVKASSLQVGTELKLPRF